jgi:hypothetical protein
MNVDCDSVGKPIDTTGHLRVGSLSSFSITNDLMASSISWNERRCGWQRDFIAQDVIIVRKQAYRNLSLSERLQIGGERLRNGDVLTENDRVNGFRVGEGLGTERPEIFDVLVSEEMRSKLLSKLCISLPASVIKLDFEVKDSSFRSSFRLSIIAAKMRCAGRAAARFNLQQTQLFLRSGASKLVTRPSRKNEFPRRTTVNPLCLTPAKI